MEKEKTTPKKWKISDIVVPAVQVIVSVLALYFLKKLLPMKYWMIIVVLLVVVGAIVLRKMFSLIERIQHSKRKKLRDHLMKKKRIVKILSGLVSLVLIIGCLMASKGFNALDNITGGEYQTQLITVIVKADSEYQELKDINGKTLGVVPGIDDVNKEKALTEITKTEGVEVTTTEYPSVTDLATALISGEIDAALLNEAYR